MRVAIAHDWLTGMRGGEKVLEVLCEAFPGSEIFTLLHVPGSVSATIEKHRIHTSFIQNIPWSKKLYRACLPLFPLAVERLRPGGFDLVLSTSHCVAKGVIAPPGVPHISYIHTPMRYVWDRFDDYFDSSRTSRIRRSCAALAARRLRAWDSSTAARVDRFVANSRNVASKVRRFYGREADVICPPVDCSRFSMDRRGPGDYYLVVSALVPYKRVDLAVEAMGRLGRRLVVIGSGPEERRLKRLAPPSVEFLGWRSPEEIAGYYSRCRALVFPGEEDFGIVPLEAMASGRPVVAFGRGGALETVVPINAPSAPPGPPGPRAVPGAPTGVFFHDRTPESLAAAVDLLEREMGRFDPPSIRARALEFDRPLFKKRISDYILSAYDELTGGRGEGGKEMRLARTPF
ncbi:MAG: glycosyltransferase [Thermodesulfobacteriota bacterium]